jgi:hypothetical protein
MPPYKELFPKGSRVRVRSRDVLLEFQRTWRFHDPLSDEMLPFAEHAATVSSLGYYHGGDVLYWLDGVPGTWHEVCLEAFSGM